MKSLRKAATLNIRMRPEQRRKLERAAVLESKRRPASIEAGPLLLELGMEGVERILAGDQVAA